MQGIIKYHTFVVKKKKIYLNDVTFQCLYTSYYIKLK